jgi:thioredoxin-dependent peroxiredoxin
MLEIGDKVPAFKLQADTGTAVNTGALGKRRVVLYLYPKDDTAGCTAEACSFRDNIPNFESLGVPVYGISPDDIKQHGKFKAKYGLNFTLLADPDHRFSEAMGAWVEKSMYGRKYMGVQRSTFIVGPDGRIEHVWPKVTPAEHAAEVLAWLRGEAPAPSGVVSRSKASTAPGKSKAKPATKK